MPIEREDDLTAKFLSRRRALRTFGLFGVGGLALLAGCGPDTIIGVADAGDDLDAGSDAGSDAGADAGSTVDAGSDAGTLDAGMDAGTDAGVDAGTDAGVDAGSADAGSDAGTSTPETCEVINDETSGPYPDKDGMISKSAYFRRDITEGKTGVPLAITLRVLNVGGSCEPIVGANVEVWHCDATGIYSEYANSMNAGSTSTTYLRGVQTTGANGEVTFDTIYPGWYEGRVTHIHVEVYNGTTLKKTTQLGFPDAINTQVYSDTALYAKGQNRDTDNDSDNVLGTQDGGHEYQLAAISGSNSAGYVASLDIGLGSY